MLPFANGAVRLDPNGSALLESKTLCSSMGTTHSVWGTALHCSVPQSLTSGRNNQYWLDVYQHLRYDLQNRVPELWGHIRRIWMPHFSWWCQLHPPNMASSKRKSYPTVSLRVVILAEFIGTLLLRCLDNTIYICSLLCCLCWMPCISHVLACLSFTCSFDWYVQLILTRFIFWLLTVLALTSTGPTCRAVFVEWRVFLLFSAFLSFTCSLDWYVQLIMARFICWLAIFALTSTGQLGQPAVLSLLNGVYFSCYPHPSPSRAPSTGMYD